MLPPPDEDSDKKAMGAQSPFAPDKTLHLLFFLLHPPSAMLVDFHAPLHAVIHAPQLPVRKRVLSPLNSPLAHKLFFLQRLQDDVFVLLAMY